jgi:peptidoglycan hydrolase-like protein with peptidoglycan-binding domain
MSELENKTETAKPVVEKKPKPEKSKYREPKAVTMDDILNSVPEPAGPAVVSNNSVDDVSLSAAVFKNINARKSLTVHHLQRRLVELGYDIAGKDKDGWFGDNTLSGIISYQEDNKVGEKGKLDAETFLAIFEGDPNVRPNV